MDTKPQAQSNGSMQTRELLIGSFIVAGVLLIIISFLTPAGPVQDTIRSLGLSLAPAGVVTLILSRYATATTRRLLEATVETTIRDRLEDGIEEIAQHMKSLSPLFAAGFNLGLENVHLNRAAALESFAWFLDAEIRRAERGEQAQVWIVSSSMKGFLNAVTEHFDGRGMMRRIAECGCQVRIMMTHPDVADSRAKQERRAAGEIPQEVKMSLAYLKRVGVKREEIRYYPGTPTVFAVATTDRMLLNPYPYQTEAFRCFSVIVHKTLDPTTDIFHQYMQHHFERPWERAVVISVAEWDALQ